MQGRIAGAVLVVGLAVAGCSSGSGPAADGTTPATDPAAPTGSAAPTDSGAPTTATTPQVWTAAPNGEHQVPGHYRQGLAKSDDGWIFTTNEGIYATDGSFTPTSVANAKAIPADLAAAGYDHIGDGDVVGDQLWVPLEKEDKVEGHQVTARFDAKTLAYQDSFVVPQHHNAFVTVDHGIAYSTDEFDDDTVVRYRVDGTKVVPEAPLKLSRKLDNIQGGDVADGALWLSTDDDHNGVYRVDLETGEVQDLGTMGHIPGEGEGIDATKQASGLLHALVADEAIVPMYVEDLAVTSKPA